MKGKSEINENEPIGEEKKYCGKKKEKKFSWQKSMPKLSFLQHIGVCLLRKEKKMLRKRKNK